MDEMEAVVLTKNLPDHGLKAGDVGAVVHRYRQGREFEVEFVRADGRTVALVTVSADDVRPMADEEILHARRLAS